MKQLSILYVDFETEERVYYSSLFKSCLQDVSVVKDGDDAYQFYLEFKPDIIVLEPLVPNGLALVKKIRQNDYQTILCAITNDTSTSLLQEIVELFFIAYLHKPVSSKELMGTMVKIKRTLEKEEKVKLSKDAYWDKKAKMLYINNRYIILTKRETKLFELLVTNRCQFCSDDDIFFYVWGDELDKSVGLSSIRTLIKNLRKKLPNGFIKNRYSLGYKINP